MTNFTDPTQQVFYKPLNDQRIVHIQSNRSSPWVVFILIIKKKFDKIYNYLFGILFIHKTSKLSCRLSKTKN